MNFFFTKNVNLQSFFFFFFFLGGGVGGVGGRGEKGGEWEARVSDFFLLSIHI